MQGEPTFPQVTLNICNNGTLCKRILIIADLNETLQLWMACRGTRTLVDVNTKCLSSLIHSDTEACISALLGKLGSTALVGLYKVLFQTPL